MIGFLAGLVSALALQLLLLRRRWSRLTVVNYRQLRIPAIGGIVVAGGLVAAEIVAGLSGRPSVALNGDPEPEQRAGLLVVALGFYLLGLIDDVFGDSSSKGLAGHLRALMRKRVTTGAIKAIGGLVLAAVVSLLWEGDAAVAVLDALVIALAANLLNLLDLRPGRASKVYLVFWLPLALASRSAGFFDLSIALAGATVAWMFADLKEKGVLGDSGANMLGAMLGAGVVLNLGITGRLVVLAMLAGVTLASERWSFSRAIESTAALRWLDRMGRI
ncbi:MAG: hypothetical protein ACT4OM_02580 [Actinomycetota bacterium]